MNKLTNISELFILFKQMELYKKYGINKVGVFGSFARGEVFHDIDLYIEEDMKNSQVQDLKQKLEAETGIRFDIMMKKNAEPVILHRAFKDMRYATAH